MRSLTGRGVRLRWLLRVWVHGWRASQAARNYRSLRHDWRISAGSVDATVVKGPQRPLDDQAVYSKRADGGEAKKGGCDVDIMQTSR